MLNLLISLLLFTNLNFTDARVYGKCSNHLIKKKCLNDGMCQWCNHTKTIISNNITRNITGVCSINTKCLYNDSNCINSSKFKAMCVTVNIFFSLCLIFILLASMIYISSFTKRVLNNYYNNITVVNSNIHDGINDYVKQKALIITIVDLFVFVPPVIFWCIGSIAFLYWFIFIMMIVILLSCSETTNDYYKRKVEKSSYNQIN